jgi:hypothetical protein
MRGGDTLGNQPAKDLPFVGPWTVVTRSSDQVNETKKAKQTQVTTTGNIRQPNQNVITRRNWTPATKRGQR